MATRTKHLARTQSKVTICSKQINTRTLLLRAHDWQMLHAAHSGADICADCVDRVETEHDYYQREERRAGYIAGLMAKEGIL